MTFAVKRLAGDQVQAVLALVWETYLRFEAPGDDPEGPATFRELIIDNETYRENCRTGVNRMWGAYTQESQPQLAAVMVMKGESHVSLVYTRGAFHRQGAASAIFRQLTADVRRENPQVEQLTLNASAFGKPFYLHLGFAVAGPERVNRGIHTTPMTYSLR